MSKTISSVFLCTLMLIIFSCKQTHENLPQPNVTEQAVSATILKAAKTYFTKNTEGYQNDVLSVKTRSSRIIKPNWKTAKIRTLTNGATVLVLDIPYLKVNNQDYSLIRNMIFLLRKDKIVYGRIIEIAGTKNALAANNYDLITKFNDKTINNFEGTIISYDLKYRFLRGRGYKNGKYDNNVSALTTKPKVSSLGSSEIAFASGAPRLSSSLTTYETDCTDYYLVTYYPNGNENWQYLYTNCSTTHVPDDNVIPVAGGTTVTPGTATPGQFGAPPSPIDGQVWHYVYPDGTSIDFTYNQDLNAWLLPDFQALVDGGHEIFYPPNVGPTFGGKFLTTLGVVALAEPSFVGEVIWGGVASVYLGIYIYDRITFLRQTQEKTENLDYCTPIYVGCKLQTPSAPCSMCMQYCDVQEIWDYVKCPGIQPVYD